METSRKLHLWNRFFSRNKLFILCALVPVNFVPKLFKRGYHP